MKKQFQLHELNKTDALIASVVSLVALAMYVRTLSPDILYGDSAEFQTLAYTLGITHSTGYPVYLIIARLVGLFPVGTLAWRVNLVSALCAALAIGGLFFFVRNFTNSRAAGVLACASLAISYTFWSQAIRAEIYCPATAFLVWILVLLFRWQQAPEQRLLTLGGAAFLAGLLPGIHATAALIAPAAALFVVLVLWRLGACKTIWQRTILYAAGGTLLGASFYFFSFVFTSLNNPPNSFITVMYLPNRSFWNLTANELNSFMNQFRYTVGALQWKQAFYQGGSEAALDSFAVYVQVFFEREFSVWLAVLSIFGWIFAFKRNRDLAAFLLAVYLTILYMVINYHPGDQDIFFLPTYIPLLGMAGIGMGVLLEWFAQNLRKRLPGILRMPAYFSLVLLIGYFLGKPYAKPRWEALQSGVASFVQDTYNFPVDNLHEPRLRVKMMLAWLPDTTLLLMDWRELYTALYLAHIEGLKPGLRIVEAMPTGNNGKIAASMVETIQAAHRQGQKVYAQQAYPGLRDHFRLLPVGSSDWYNILPKR